MLKDFLSRHATSTIKIYPRRGHVHVDRESFLFMKNLLNLTDDEFKGVEHMIVIELGLIMLFMILGIFINLGKASFLIAGYNTLPKEKQEAYDTAALGKFMGKSMFALAFCMGLWTLSDVFDRQWLFTVGLILFICIIIFMLVYANTGNRFKKEQ